MHFFSLSLFLFALSTNFVYFVAPSGAWGGGAECGGTARRVTYNLGWVKSDRKTKNTQKEKRRKLQTAHVQICTNAFLYDCMCVCVQKYRRPSKNQSARLEIVGPVKRRIEIGLRVEIHPLIASIRQETLSTFEMDAARSRKQKPTTLLENVYNNNNNKKICSKMPSNAHTRTPLQVSSAHLSHIDASGRRQNLLLATCEQKCCQATFRNIRGDSADSADPV